MQKCYPSLIANLVGNPAYQRLVVLELAKTIQQEIKAYTSAKYRETNRKAVAALKWQELLNDLTPYAPVLMSILNGIVKKPSKSTPLVCMLVSMVMKR